MSNYWDLYCVTCSSSCGLRRNHGDHDLADLRGLIGAAADCGKFFRECAAGFQFSFDGDEGGVGSRFFAWAEEHQMHDVRVRSEYGYFLNDCHKQLRCASCDSIHWCKLKVDHVGACSLIDPET